MNNALAVTYVTFPSGDLSSAKAKIFLPSTLSIHDSTSAVEPSGRRLLKKDKLNLVMILKPQIHGNRPMLINKQ